MAAQRETIDDSRELEWQAVKRRMLAVVPAFEEHASGPSPYFKMQESERSTLVGILKVPPATRSYTEVRTLLNLLRGSDLLLKLDDDMAATVVGSMRLIEKSKGEVIATEQSAADAFLTVVEGIATVLIRDITVTPPRAPLFNIHPGGCLSEAMLIEHSRRAPSLVATEDVLLLRVCRADFHAALASWHLELLERKVAALQAVPCFLSEDRRTLRPIAERMSLEKAHAHTTLITQGEEAARLYIIAAGEATVVLRVTSGEVLHIAAVGPGSLFGEIGVALNVPHTASIVSTTNMVLYTLPRGDLHSVADPSVIERLVAMAHSYPTEAEHLERLDLGHHWAAYKERMIDAHHAELTAAPFKSSNLFGGRPSPPPAAQRRALAIPSAVRSSYLLAMDGTPIPSLDLRDMQARARRREKDVGLRRHAALEPQLAAYLATKPGGDLWTGNAHLREYVAKEEQREKVLRKLRSRRFLRGDTTASTERNGELEAGRAAAAIA